MKLGQDRPSGPHLVAPVAVGGDVVGVHDASTATVVFNTNEQKTATIGRVPRVNKMSSFYGVQDLNSSIQDRNSSLTKESKSIMKNGKKDLINVPTVYRIGSLHLSEGVSEKNNIFAGNCISMSLACKVD